MTDTDRIETLETQVRTLKKMLFGLVALVAVGSLLAATAIPKVPDVIQAKKFEVVNDDGDVLVECGVGKNGGGEIKTFNSKGKVLVGIYGSAQDSGGLIVENGKGEKTVMLLVTNTDSGMVITQSAKGKVTSTLPKSSLPER